jgi:hypothetical protein
MTKEHDAKPVQLGHSVAQAGGRQSGRAAGRRHAEYKKARPRRQPDQVLGGSMAIEHRNR